MCPDAYTAGKTEGHRHGALPSALAGRGDPPRVQIFSSTGPALCPSPPRRDGARPRREPAVVLRSVCQFPVAVLFKSVGDQLARPATAEDVGQGAGALRVHQTSLSALSEAAYVFDA